VTEDPAAPHAAHARPGPPQQGHGPATARKPLFTGAVSSPAPFADPVTAGGPADDAGEAPSGPARGRRRGVAPSPSAYWRGWPEVRADLRSAAGIVAALALTGVPAGLLWWALAPRADFRVTEDGPVPIGDVSPELLVADDAVFALVLAGAGLLAGVAAWFLRRRRGVATVLALALGACLTAVVAWQVGELLGAGPSETELADVGARLTTSLTLSSPAAMALAPFTALLAYVVAVLCTPDDGLGRTEPGTPAPVGEQASVN
jgi:LPXTG-motif cell wall-anchored protein